MTRFFFFSFIFYLIVNDLPLQLHLLLSIIYFYYLGHMLVMIFLILKYILFHTKNIIHIFYYYLINRVKTLLNSMRYIILFWVCLDEWNLLYLKFTVLRVYIRKKKLDIPITIMMSANNLFVNVMKNSIVFHDKDRTKWYIFTNHMRN